MLREAVNLSPDPKQQLISAPHAEDECTDSETEAPAHSCYLGQHQSHGSEEGEWRQCQSQRSEEGQGRQHQQQQQQEQDAGRTQALLREAYKEMLLQQQARHRSELERRQSKYQKQLDAQVGPLQGSSDQNILAL